MEFYLSARNEKTEAKIRRRKTFVNYTKVDLINFGNTLFAYSRAAFQTCLEGRPETMIRKENWRKS